jgi:hypothetical protein
MTLFEVEELTRYWTDHPPLHLTIAAYLGIGKEQRRRPRPASTQAASESLLGVKAGHLLAQLGPAFTSGDVHTGLQPVVLDFTELRRMANLAN